MSRNMLEKRGPHTYFDDLDSFYYTLIWVLCAWSGPNSPKSSLPPHITLWDDDHACDYKNAELSLFDQWKDIPMDPWFGGTYRRLIKALFDFFYTRFSLRLEMMAERDPLVDYEEFISPIKDAITRLEG